MTRSGAHRRRATVVAALVALVAAVTMFAPAPKAGADDTALFGEGGSFAEPIVNQLETDATSAIAPLVPAYFNADVDQGRQDFAAGTADFAVSEFPLTTDEAATATKNGRSFAYVPFAADAVAIGVVILCSNDTSLKPGTLCPNIQLTVPQVADIFTNDITSWTDPTFAQAQGGQPIAPVAPTISADHEVDPTYSDLALATLFENNSVAKPIWESYLTLNKITSDTPSETWPTGGGATGGDRALADALIPVNETTNIPQQNPQLWGNGSVAPLPSDWLGAPRNIPSAAVLNPAGAFVSPPRPGGPVDSMVAAEKYSTLDPTTNLVTFNYSTTDTSVYPIPAMSYLIVPTSGLDHAKATALAAFIRFVLGSQGQADVQALGAAPVTSAMVTAGMHVADEVASQGMASSTSTTTASSSTSSTSSTSAASTDPASSSSSSDSGGAGASLASDSGPTLAFTGGNPLPMLATGGMLTLVGLVARLWFRRRPMPAPVVHSTKQRST